VTSLAVGWSRIRPGLVSLAIGATVGAIHFALFPDFWRELYRPDRVHLWQIPLDTTPYSGCPDFFMIDYFIRRNPSDTGAACESLWINIRY
jgi:hypothetical protein